MSMAIHRNVRKKDFRRRYPWEDLRVGEQFHHKGAVSNVRVHCMVWSYKMNRRFIYFRAEDGKLYVEREK